MPSSKRGSMGIILILLVTVPGLVVGLQGYDAKSGQNQPETRSRLGTGPMTYINETLVIENQTWSIEENTSPWLSSLSLEKFRML